MRTALLPVAILVASTCNAATAIDGWYSSAFGGYAYIPNNINRTFSGIKFTDALYRNGWDAGGSFGYKSNPMRYEGEVTYLTSNLKQFKANRVKLNYIHGYTNGVLALANIYYDFAGVLDCLQPFIGVGIGYGWVKAHAASKISAQLPSFTANDSVFTYQATTGITYNFAENYAFNLGYRYIITTRASALGQSYQAHLANVGAVYRFDGNNYK